MRLILGTFFCLSLSAQAARTCLVEEINEDGFKSSCDEEITRAVAGDAYATFVDAFNLNPASLPIKLSPFGVEAIVSENSQNLSGADWNFGIIKGLGDIGVGASSNSDNTFFSTSLFNESSTGLSIPSNDIMPNTNLGIASDFLKNSLKKSKIVPLVGFALRNNTAESSQGFSIGTSVSKGPIALGASYIREAPRSSLSLQESSSNFSLGVDLRHFVFDVASTQTTTTSQNSYRLSYRTYIAAASLFLGPFIVSGGYKKYVTSYGVKKDLSMLAIQLKLWSRARLLYLHNYVPGVDSLGLQVLLF